MAPDRRKVRTDRRTEWTDAAKTISLRLRRGIKIGECRATAYAFLRLWYKFEVRKSSRFVRFTFPVK